VNGNKRQILELNINLGD